MKNKFLIRLLTSIIVLVISLLYFWEIIGAPIFLILFMGVFIGFWRLMKKQNP